MLPRLATIALGLWLMISPGILRHPSNTGINAMMTGLLVAMVGACAIWLRPLRYANVALGLWMMASSVLMPHHSLLLTVHDGLLGALIVFFAAIPGQALRTAPDMDVMGPYDRTYTQVVSDHDPDRRAPLAP